MQDGEIFKAEANRGLVRRRRGGHLSGSNLETKVVAVVANCQVQPGPAERHRNS
jgi:hypothetical protein